MRLEVSQHRKIQKISKKWNKLHLGKLLKGGFWIFIGGNLTNILGYIFWILASKIVSPSIIGFGSVIITLQTIFITITSLGLPTGARHYFGLSKGEEDYNKLVKYFFTSLIILAIINLCAIFFLSYSYFNPNLLNSEESLYLLILTLLSFWEPLLYSLFISILKTKIVAFSHTLSAILKLSVGILVLFFNPNKMGVISVFIFGFIVEGLVLIFAVIRLFKNLNITISVDLRLSKIILKTSFPAWAADILVILGQSFGIIVVFNIVGGVEAGLYFIALSIARLIYSLPGSIQMLIFPVLSGMKEGQENATSKVIKFALVLGVPSALIICIYAEVPLILLGPQYADAAPLLTIIVLGAIIYPIYAGYYSYLYAIGKYKHVILLGFVLNGSRLILYFILGLTLLETGVALSYTLGIILGFLTMIISTFITGFKIEWNNYLKIIIIPGLIAILLYYFNIHWVIGVILILSISLISYTRMGIINKKDLHEIFSAFISKEKLTRLYSNTKFLSKVLFGG